MKKFFSFLAVAAMAIAANATYYVAGNGTAGNPWCDGKNWSVNGSAMNEENTITFKDVPAGTYQFKVTDGSWGGEHEMGYDKVNAECSTEGYELAGGNNVMFTTGTTADVTISVVEAKICLLFTKGEFVISSWTVCGGQTELLGKAWDPAYTANDMTKQEDGSWKLVKTGVTLPAMKYEFKVAANHAWSIKEVPGSGNVEYTLAEAGIYDVTFTLNAAYTELTYNFEKKGEAVIIPVIAIAGTMNSWKHETNRLVTEDEGKTYTGAITLDAKEYEFKVVDVTPNKWYGNTGTMTRESCTGWVMDNNANCKLDADIAGEYTFTFEYDTKKLSVEFPSIHTSVENATMSEKAVKTFINGQLVIIRDGVRYNAQGAAL